MREHAWTQLDKLNGCEFCFATDTLAIGITALRAHYPEELAGMVGYEVLIWAIRRYVREYPGGKARYFMLRR